MALSKPCVNHEEVEAVQKVIESGWLTEGPVTKQFEETVAKYVGAKYAIATTSCTTALELCLKAYNIKGEVLVPDFTFPATAQAVINTGSTPVLTDVQLDSYNMPPIKHRWTDACMPVSWGGNPLTSDGYGLNIIEDAACSLGAEFNGEKTGSIHTSCFSFHATKNVTTGEGGVITTNDEKLMRRIRQLKNFGESSKVLLSQQWDGRYDYLRWCRGRVDFVGHGSNCKMSDINAAVGLVQMGKLDGIVNRRVEMAKVYSELLEDVRGVVPPSKHPSAKHTYQCYAVYVKNGNRDEIIGKLAKKGIETQIGTYALHLLSAFKKCKRTGPLTNSEKLFHNLLRLPMAYDVTEEQQQFVVEELKKCVS